LWDVEAGAVQAVLETEIGDVHSVAFSPDGALVAYGGADPAVWVWNIASNDNHPLLSGDAEQVFAVAFSSDGQMIVSGDSDATRLWNATTGENLATLASPSGEAVNSVAFSPDGTLIASGGAFGGVVLWGTSGAGGAAEQEIAASPSDTDEEAETTTTEETTTTAATSCTISAPSNANLRSGPGTNFERAGSLSAGQSAEVNGQAQGADGMTWYRLSDGTWVRSDVVGSPAECGSVPAIAP
jgi:WD40 repeat protein